MDTDRRSPATAAAAAAGGDAKASFERQPEIIDFLSSVFGSYPFRTAGGIVENVFTGFALETQTRPVYSPVFSLRWPEYGVIVHELAHQWVGDSLAVEAWQHIWLNEGFATYAEWMWSAHEGEATEQEIFDLFYNEFFPAEDTDFWDLPIGDPGTERLFDRPVYFRGAMTLHVLRMQVGDRDFFRILQQWARKQAGGNVTTDEFIALAEHVSHQQLDELFDTWLFSTTRPELNAAALKAQTLDPEGQEQGPRPRRGAADARAVRARVQGRRQREGTSPRASPGLVEPRRALASGAMIRTWSNTGTRWIRARRPPGRVQNERRNRCRRRRDERSCRTPSTRSPRSRPGCCCSWRWSSLPGCTS